MLQTISMQAYILNMAIHMCVLVTQSCLTLCDPMDCNPPGSSVHEFSKQEYWSQLLFPSPGGLPDQGIEPRSPALQADSLPSEIKGSPGYTYTLHVYNFV